MPVLLYRETRVPLKKHLSRTQASRMRFLQSVKGCTRRLYNEDIRKELKIFNIQYRIAENKEIWIVHLNRMTDSRLPKVVWQYNPIGQRSIGRPRKRWWSGTADSPSTCLLYTSRCV